MEKSLSIGALGSGLASRFGSNGLQCSLLALLAFLPMSGLTLLSSAQMQYQEGREFCLAALTLSRFLTPPIAVLIVAYLARKDGLLPDKQTLWGIFTRSALPSIGLVLAILTFGSFASLLFVVPGLAFFLAASVSLPALVSENLRGPSAIKRSWGLTQGHRWTLLGFWLSYLLFSMAVLVAIILGTSRGTPPSTELLPLAQQEFFLPSVLGLAFLYSGLVTASYESYTQLLKIEKSGVQRD